MGTNTGTIMTLANSIIGVSVLAMPFCFKQCGIILSIVMLIASSLLSRLACHFLLKSAVMARRRTFEFLAFHTFGWTGKFAVEVFIIGFLMGTCIAFFVVMGDLGPAIVAKILGASNTEALRPSVLIGLAVFVVLPLGMLKNVDSLSSVSMATIGFYICLVLKVIGESLPHLLAGDWYEHVHLWRPAGILQCIPIFSMALFCQTQLFEIYESMHNASLDRMNFVIRAACNICTAVYICVGFFGYIAFCTQQFTGNVLMSFTPSIGSEIIKLGFVLSVAVSFPLVIFPCRASLYSLLFRRITVPHYEGVGSHIPEARFKCLTVFIISIALVIGLLIPNIELVLGLVGSTIGVLICVMFPAAAFICMSTKSSNDRLLAQVLLFVGALILVLGTYATLKSTNQPIQSDINKNEISPLNINKAPSVNEKIDNSLIDIPPKLEPKQEIKVLTEKLVGKDQKKPVEPNANLQPAQQKEMNVDLKGKVDKRQEPPIPVEPIGDALQVPSDAPSAKEYKIDTKMSDTNVENIKIGRKGKTKEPDVIKPELENKETKIIVEQIHQDAINKEEEELAEAEKRANAVGENKNEELLRKLEKHEAQQMKILEKQKEILEALQEHQERDLMKQKQEDIVNVVNLNEKETNPLKVNQVAGQKETSIPKTMDGNIEQKDVGHDKINSILKKDTVFISRKIEPQPVALNISDTEPPPLQKRQDLLQQIANGELSKDISRPPKEIIKEEKSKQVEEKIVPYNNFSNQNPSNTVEIKESFHIADPKFDVKQQAPAQPLLLERLKSPPLPLQKNGIKPAPKVVEEKPLDSGNEINAIRREILQEPIVSTQAFEIDTNKKNVTQRNENDNLKNAEEELHDREKRDIEEMEKASLFLNSQEIHNKTFNEINVSKSVMDDQNCQRADVGTKNIVKRNNSIYEKPATILKFSENNVTELKEKIEQSPSKEILAITLSEPIMTLENGGEKSDLETHKIETNVPSLPPNSSSVQRDQRGELVNNLGDLVQINDKINDANIDSVIIKTSRHLSDPDVKSNSNNDVSVLKQNVLSPDTKPMKRDLKSIAIQEEKPSDNRTQG